MCDRRTFFGRYYCGASETTARSWGCTRPIFNSDAFEVRLPRPVPLQLLRLQDERPQPFLRDEL